MRLTDTELVSENSSSPVYGEVSPTSILAGGNHKSVGRMQESVLSPEEDQILLYKQASPLSDSFILSNIPGRSTRCQMLFKALDTC